PGRFGDRVRAVAGQSPGAHNWPPPCVSRVPPGGFHGHPDPHGDDCDGHDAGRPGGDEDSGKHGRQAKFTVTRFVPGSVRCTFTTLAAPRLTGFGDRLASMRHSAQRPELSSMYSSDAGPTGAACSSEAPAGMLRATVAPWPLGRMNAMSSPPERWTTRSCG